MNIVRELRKRKGIQQKELALIVGVAQPTISEWEKNKKDPSGVRLKKLAEYFGVDELIILGKGVVDLNSEELPANLSKKKQMDQKLIDIMIDLSPEESQRVVDFVAGIKAARKE